MATTGELVSLATINGYDMSLALPGQFIRPTTNFGSLSDSTTLRPPEDSRYLGQLVQNGNSNEFALVSRGTNSLGNMIDNAAIFLGKFGLGFSTNQFEDGKAYAAKVSVQG